MVSTGAENFQDEDDQLLRLFMLQHERDPVQLLPWPHPNLDHEPSMSTLRYLLSLEPTRILSCLGDDDDLRPESQDLLRTTLQLRELSSGMRLTAASAWARFYPDRWEHYREENPLSSGLPTLDGIQ